MASNTKKNAIEKRIDELTDIWNEFAQNSETLGLRWLLAADEARMIDLFLEMQNEEISDIPDLFIRFEAPFENPVHYGFILRQALCDQYEESQEDMDQEGLATDWTCPLPQPGDLSTFINSCRSFGEHYSELMENLVVVLTPEKVADVRAWEQWLLDLVTAELPPNLKIMVVDSLDSPALERLAQEAPDLVQSVAPALDMPGAMEELVRDVPGHGPGHTFRRLFVGLTNAAGTGDLKKSQKIADSALSIAAKENWPQMQVVILMALGGAFTGAGKFDDALANYKKSEQIAADANQAGDPAAPKLMLQSKMAQASALIGQSRYADAAAIYESAAALAENQQDHFMILENWRMAAYCHEESEEMDRSWDTGRLAIQATEKMDDDLRVNSTLPYVGQGLLRIAEKRNDTDGAEKVEQRMVELIGPDWKSKLEPGELPT